MKKFATIVRPIKTQIHFNLCFISKYISIRSNRRSLLIIWAMLTYLLMFLELYYCCSSVTYINCNNKFCIASQEAVTRRCSVKKLLLKLTQNSQESTCVVVCCTLLNKVRHVEFMNDCFCISKLKIIKKQWPNVSKLQQQEEEV